MGAHQEGERLAVPEFVVAPALEPAKDRVKAVFGVFFEMPVNGDVARIADLLGEIGRVVNEFRPKMGVLLVAPQ